MTIASALNPTQRCAIALLLVCISLLVSQALLAQTSTGAEDAIPSPDSKRGPTLKPKWEFGLGGGGLSLPNYVGSKQNQDFLLPVPYFAYRSERIRASNSGLRGLLYEGKKLKSSISIAASLPVGSDEADARDGMPGLKPLFEFGPRLQYHAWEGALWPGSQHLLRVDWPLRTAMHISADEQGLQGWVTQPSLQYRIESHGHRLHFAYGVIVGNERYNDYFYQVAETYVTDDRRYYDASAGEVARFGLVSYILTKQRWQVRLFARHYDLNHAANLDSPLVESSSNLSYGFSLVYIMSRSRQWVTWQD